MSAPAIIQAIHASGLADWMRHSLKAMPVVESVHVLALATVFGSILLVDLRLLGLRDTHRAVTALSRDLLRVTWSAFVVAVLSGALMFMPNAITYYDNTAFRLKLLAILAAGVNMVIFQLFTWRSVKRWDSAARTPLAARTAAALSIILWITVILLGRWIGFTKGYDFSVPEDVQFEFPE
jgi:hypothetical protein